MNLLPDRSEARQAFRRLLRERGFAATAILTLALCIGANVAIFAVVDAVLIRSLPFAEPERLAVVYNSYPGAGVERAGASTPNYYDRKGAIAAFSAVSIFQGGSAIVGEAGSPRRIERDRVSPDFFDTLGIQLLAGNMFTEDNMLYEASGVAVLTHGFWQSYFDGDPDIVGKTFQVDSLPVTILGILPPSVHFLSSRAQFYIPAASSLDDRQPNRRHSNNFGMIARLADNATFADAQAEINAFNQVQIETDPFAKLVGDVGYKSTVKPLRADHVASIRPTLLLLQAGVLCLLVIGAVNIVNLLLIRASSQVKELAVRQALGAGRRHIARQAALETAFIGLSGGVLGVGLGAIGIHLLSALGTDQLPLGSTIRLDWRVGALTLALSLAVGLLLAAPIVWFNLRHRIAAALQSESRSGTASQAAHRVRHGFIVAQIALAFTLLASAGLLTTSLQRVMDKSPGFAAENVLTAGISLPWKNYPDAAKRRAFVERLLPEVRALPGVLSVGIVTSLPFTNNVSNSATAIEGVEPNEQNPIRAHINPGAAGEYWQAMGIPLIEGRYLEPADYLGETRVCLVDQALAEMYWPDSSPIGRRLANDVSFSEENASTIVGVVATVRQNDLSETKPLGTVYYSYRHQSNQSFSLAIRSALPPESLAKSLQQTILQMDPELPLDDAKPLQTRIDDSLVARRSPALLAAIFASVAVLLAAIGTYGILAYAVAQRRREIGIRLALGARPSQIRNQFLLLGLRLLLVGLVIGAAGSWAAGKAMGAVLFEVPSIHPPTTALTAAIIVAVTLGACLVPSFRAARTHPSHALSDA